MKRILIVLIWLVFLAAIVVVLARWETFRNSMW